MVGEYKTLGELVQSDPALKSRVVIAKVRPQLCADPAVGLVCMLGSATN